MGLAYQPPLARSLALFRQKTIALLIPDILNPYFTEIVRGVQDEAGADKYLPLVLDTAEDPQREVQFLRLLSSQPVSGAIILGSRIPAQEFSALHAHFNMPMVVINRSLHLPNVSCILFELETAAYRAMHHLLDLNHTRVAFMAGPSESDTSHHRKAGILRAMNEAGLDLKPEWCPAAFPNIDGGFQAMSGLLDLAEKDRPTAIIAYNDLMAIGALHAIRLRGFRVPEDISVIGSDNISMAEHSNPPLTTIAPAKHRMGRLAMQTLRRMIEGQNLSGEGYMLVESPLVVRESTAPCPGG